MDHHARRHGPRRGCQGHVGEVDACDIGQFPAPVVRRDLRSRHRRMMQPSLIVIPVGRKIHLKRPMRCGDILLEVPALFFGPIISHAIFNLVRDDAAGNRPQEASPSGRADRHRECPIGQGLDHAPPDL